MLPYRYFFYSAKLRKLADRLDDASKGPTPEARARRRDTAVRHIERLVRDLRTRHDST